MRERYQPSERSTGSPTLLECFGFHQRQYTKPGSLRCHRLTRAFQPIRCHPEAEPRPRECMFSSFFFKFVTQGAIKPWIYPNIWFSLLVFCCFTSSPRAWLLFVVPRVNGHGKAERVVRDTAMGCDSGSMMSSELESSSFIDSEEDEDASRFGLEWLIA